MLPIPPQPHQTGPVKTGMAKRPKQKNTTQDAVIGKKEMDLIISMQDLTLKEDQNVTNMTNILAPPLVMPVMNHEEPKTMIQQQHIT